MAKNSLIDVRSIIFPSSSRATPCHRCSANSSVVTSDQATSEVPGSGRGRFVIWGHAFRGCAVVLRILRILRGGRGALTISFAMISGPARTMSTTQRGRFGIWGHTFRECVVGLHILRILRGEGATPDEHFHPLTELYPYPWAHPRRQNRTGWAMEQEVAGHHHIRLQRRWRFGS